MVVKQSWFLVVATVDNDKATTPTLRGSRPFLRLLPRQQITSPVNDFGIFRDSV